MARRRRSSSGRLAGTSITNFLYNSSRPVDLCPAIVGQEEIPEKWRAKRNTGGSGAISKHIVKAVCAALMGTVGQAYPSRSSGQAYGHCKSTSGSRGYEVSVDNTTGIVTAAHIGYQIPMAYLVEALVRPEEAGDLWRAWLRLVESFLDAGYGLPISKGELQRLDWGEHEDPLGHILWVSDELYYWTRYADAEEPDPSDSRIEANEVHTETSPGFTANLAVGNNANLLFDPDALRRALGGAAAKAAEKKAKAKATAATASKSSFIGPQLAWLMEDLADRAGAWAILLTGATGTGKTLCVREAVRLMDLPHEVIPGSEGLEDRDFIGALLLAGGETRFVDGPLTRACRRGSAADFVDDFLLLWVKEITRMRPQQLNLMTSFMDARSGHELDLMGVVPEVTSPGDRYHLLEIPDTTERIAIPVERLAIVADCNIGGQYAVQALDPALDRRFSAQYELEYLPAADEARLLETRSGLPTVTCHKMVQVANETRRLYENAEVAAPLDTGSLMAWGAKVKRGWRDGLAGAALLTLLATAANTTWMARVAGRDHRGRVDAGTKQGLLDFIATAFGIS